MKNLKKIGIVIAVLIVVIVVAVVFRDQWINIVNAFLVWVQERMGIESSKAWQFGDTVSSQGLY